MSNLERSPLDWLILGLLAALVVTNAIFLILQRAGGPLIGMAFYVVLLSITWREQRQSHRSVMVGGLLGLAVHVVEVVALGWSAYPLLLALNLLLPAALVPLAWVADRTPRHVESSK